MTPEQLEIEKKQQEVLQLEQQLSDLDAQYADICVDVQQFQQRYLSEMQPLYNRLDRWNLRIACSEMIINRLRSVRDRQMELPSDPFEWMAQSVSEARNEWQNQQAEQHFQSTQNSESSNPIESQSNQNAQSPQKAREIYRILAKRFHPDLVQSEEAREQRTELMSRINLAYQQLDVAMLMQFLEHPDIVDEKDQSAGNLLVQLIRRIAQLRSLIEQTQVKMTSELQSDLMQLYQQCKQFEAETGNEFAVLKQSVEDQIQRAKMEWMCQRARESKLWTEVEE